MDAYCRGIKMCKKLVAIAKLIGCKDVQLIDIGGGFSSVCDEKFDMVFDCSLTETMHTIVIDANSFSWRRLLMAPSRTSTRI